MNTRKKAATFKQIFFQDGGQDFSDWTIKNDGTIIDCWQFQRDIWQKHLCMNFDGLKVGEKVQTTCNGEAYGIKYPIEKIVVFTSFVEFIYMAVARIALKKLPNTVLVLHPSQGISGPLTHKDWHGNTFKVEISDKVGIDDFKLLYKPVKK